MLEVDWDAVAHAVRARMTYLAMDQRELSRRSGASAQVIRDLQRGVARTHRPATLAKIAVALDWPRDGFIRLLNGQPPVGDPNDPQVASLEQALREAEQRAHALRRELAALRSA